MSLTEWLEDTFTFTHLPTSNCLLMTSRSRLPCCSLSSCSWHSRNYNNRSEKDNVKFASSITKQGFLRPPVPQLGDAGLARDTHATKMTEVKRTMCRSPAPIPTKHFVLLPVPQLGDAGLALDTQATTMTEVKRTMWSSLVPLPSKGSFLPQYLSLETPAILLTFS